MISILGGDLICALGDKSTRLQRLKEGTYQHSKKSMDYLGEIREHPYYLLATPSSLPTLYDPISLFIPLLERLFADLNLDKQALSRCGLFLGSSANDLSIAHPLWLATAEAETFKPENRCAGNGDYAARLSEHFSLYPLSLTYNTACTSSANALIDAATMLEAELIDYAIVIGLDMFAPLSFTGFSSMQLLAEQQVKPFDKARSGLVLGESLAAVVLSRQNQQASSWSFLGGASESETASVTGSKEDGSGITKVMNKALQQSQLSTEQIDIIKAHGTGSILGDLAEINGMQKLFSPLPDFFSLKPYIGHTLGACGVSELLLTIECVEQGFIPRTPNFDSLDEQLNKTPLRDSRAFTTGNILLNYFGFGGNNSSFVINRSLF